MDEKDENNKEHTVQIRPRVFVVDNSGATHIKKDLFSITLDDMEESSKDATDRVEMLWNSRIESLFRQWAVECKENAELHRKASRKNKILYHAFGIPAIIIPIFMSSVNQFSFSVPDSKLWIYVKAF